LDNRQAHLNQYKRNLELAQKWGHPEGARNAQFQLAVLRQLDSEIQQLYQEANNRGQPHMTRQEMTREAIIDVELFLAQQRYHLSRDLTARNDIQKWTAAKQKLQQTMMPIPERN
jgi:hypothetical protein